MKGLLRKDFYMAVAYCRTIFIVLLLFLLLGVFEGASLFFIIYPAILMGTLPMTLYSYDEREHWCGYCRTMPVSSKDYVTAKYLFGFLSVCGYALLAALLSLIIQIPQGTFSIAIPLSRAGAALVTGLMGQCLTMPFLIKLGAEKGRMIYLVTLCIVCAAATFFQMYLPDGGLSIVWKMKVELAGMLAVLIVLWAASWQLSVKFYEKREFYS